jgi:hypothetical protein
LCNSEPIAKAPKDDCDNATAAAAATDDDDDDDDQGPEYADFGTRLATCPPIVVIIIIILFLILSLILILLLSLHGLYRDRVALRLAADGREDRIHLRLLPLRLALEDLHRGLQLHDPCRASERSTERASYI